MKSSPIKENYSPYDDRRSIKKRLIFENASEYQNTKLKRNRISLNEIDSFTNNTSIAKDFNTDRIYLYDKSSEFSMNLGKSELQAGFISDRKRAITKKSHSMIEDTLLNRPNRIINQENKDYFKRLREKYNIENTNKLYREIQTIQSEAVSKFNESVQTKSTTTHKRKAEVAFYQPQQSIKMTTPKVSTTSENFSHSTVSVLRECNRDLSSNESKRIERVIQAPMKITSRTPYPGVSSKSKNRVRAQSECTIELSHPQNPSPSIFSIEMLEKAVRDTEGKNARIKLNYEYENKAELDFDKVRVTTQESILIPSSKHSDIDTPKNLGDTTLLVEESSIEKELDDMQNDFPQDLK